MPDFFTVSAAAAVAFVSCRCRMLAAGQWPEMLCFMANYPGGALSGHQKQALHKFFSISIAALFSTLGLVCW